MGTHMKTTIEIAAPLLAEAKRAAEEAGVTLRALVEDGLRRALAERRPDRFKLRRASFKGSGLQPGVREGRWEQVAEAIYSGRGA